MAVMTESDIRVLKIGGGVLTDKSGFEELSQVFSGVMRVVAESDCSLVLVHGAGSFGHPHVEKWGVDTPRGVYEVRSGVRKLNSLVVDELLSHECRAVGIHPSCCSGVSEGELSLDTEHVKSMVRMGYLPVLHGDCVLSGGGFEVVSGDSVAVKIGEMFDTEVGFCTSVEGVFDHDGDVVSEVSSIQDFPDRGRDGVDVTGGMEGKVRELLRSKCGGWIFGVESLDMFLEEGYVEDGTRVS